jgi:hypothetical protein
VGYQIYEEHAAALSGQVPSEGRRHAKDTGASEATVQEAQAKKVGLMDQTKGVTVCLSSISIWFGHPIHFVAKSI